MHEKWNKDIKTEIEVTEQKLQQPINFCSVAPISILIGVWLKRGTEHWNPG